MYLVLEEDRERPTLAKSRLACRQALFVVRVGIGGHLFRLRDSQNDGLFTGVVELPPDLGEIGRAQHPAGRVYFVVEVAVQHYFL